MKPLSERISAELVHANKLGDTDLADILRQAVDQVRRLETAPVAVIDALSTVDGQEHNRPVLEHLVKNRKRVMLVELEAEGDAWAAAPEMTSTIRKPKTRSSRGTDEPPNAELSRAR